MSYTQHIRGGPGNRMRNSLETVLDRDEMKNSELCILHVGNPLVLMRRPAIFNLETGPSLNRSGVASLVKTKDSWNNEQRTMRNAPVSPQRCGIHTQTNTHIHTQKLLASWGHVRCCFCVHCCRMRHLIHFMHKYTVNVCFASANVRQIRVWNVQAFLRGRNKSTGSVTSSWAAK